jgi:hypothetical protein
MKDPNKENVCARMVLKIFSGRQKIMRRNLPRSFFKIFDRTYIVTKTVTNDTLDLPV